MQIRQLSLFLGTIMWAILIGAIVYSHVAFMPGYLHHLPQSTHLVTGADSVQDARFWMSVHPVALLLTILALVLNRKEKNRRKLILTTTLIYVVTLIVTAIYFVPALMEFAGSATNPSLTPAQWQERGITWERLSWLRGAFMFTGFVCLLVALARGQQEETIQVPVKNKKAREAAVRFNPK